MYYYWDNLLFSGGVQVSYVVTDAGDRITTDAGDYIIVG